MNTLKPLGHKSYGHIGHLPGSRAGLGDHHVSEGQYRICCVKPRDRQDHIVVQEKLDGTNVSVANINGRLVPLNRAGYPAVSSPYEAHRLFHLWAIEHAGDFADVLAPGERLCGEWMAMAHGTLYEGPLFTPFVAFDIMHHGHQRLTHIDFMARVAGTFRTPRIIHCGSPIHYRDLQLEPSGHGATTPVEGAVWRVERNGEVDFLAKWVRPDKVDGAYLPEITGKPPVWLWRPA